jgi:hypothetical protein
MPARPVGDDLGNFVAGSVIDDNYFDRPIALSQDRIERMPDQVRPVEGWHDDANQS